MKAKSLSQLGAPTVLVFALWFGVSWSPSVRAEADAEQRIVEAEADRSELMASLQRVRVLPELEAEIGQRREQTALAVPTGSQIGAFVQALDGLAVSNGISIQELTPIQIQGNSASSFGTPLPIGVSSVSMSLTAEGEYPNLLGFLRSIEAMDRLVILDSLDVSAGAEDETLLSIDLQLRVFTTESISQSTGDNSFTGSDLGAEIPASELAFEGDPALAEQAPVLPPGLTEEELSEFLEGVRGSEVTE